MRYENFEKNRDYQIRKQVIDFLKKLDIDTSIAIDIAQVISRMEENIQWAFVDLEGLAGFTCYISSKDQYTIFLDYETSERCLERIIFTMAHEVGHIVLGHFNLHSNSTYISNRVLEQEANIFADELLMPSLPIIEKKLTADEVSEKYLVSRSAASYKIRHMQRNTLYRENQQQHIRISSILSKMSSYDKDHWIEQEWVLHSMESRRLLPD